MYLERKIRERCLESGEDPSQTIGFIPAVVGALVEARYVDDERFAEATIHRMRRAGRSTAQIDASLRAKGISESIRQALLPDADRSDQDSKAAWRVVQRRRLGPYCSNPEIRDRDRDRHLAALIRLGFDPEVAERVIDAEIPEDLY